MRNRLEDSILEHKSRPPLRWVANIFGNIASAALWRAALLDEDNNWNRKYDFYVKVYDIFMPLYSNYGSWYKLDIDMSGKGWDDYDENGVPYWEKLGVIDPDYTPAWDYEDSNGDAFRIIKK